MGRSIRNRIYEHLASVKKMQVKRSRRRQGLKCVGDVPSIAPIGINQYV